MVSRLKTIFEFFTRLCCVDFAPINLIETKTVRIKVNIKIIINLRFCFG